MQCEKCASQGMEARKLFRSSGCLVVAGFGLIVCSALALGIGILSATVGPRATRDAVATHDAGATSEALAALRRIPGLPPGVVQEFEAKEAISEETLAELPFDRQSRVRDVMIAYHGQRASTGFAGLFTAGVGTFIVLVLFAFGIPGGIVGLILVRKRKVWRCAACGFAFERT